MSGNFRSYLGILLTTQFSLGSQNKPLYPLELLPSLTAYLLSWGVARWQFHLQFFWTVAVSPIRSIHFLGIKISKLAVLKFVGDGSKIFASGSPGVIGRGAIPSSIPCVCNQQNLAMGEKNPSITYWSLIQSMYCMLKDSTPTLQSVTIQLTLCQSFHWFQETR